MTTASKKNSTAATVVPERVDTPLFSLAAAELFQVSQEALNTYHKFVLHLLKKCGCHNLTGSQGFFLFKAYLSLANDTEAMTVSEFTERGGFPGTNSDSQIDKFENNKYISRIPRSNEGDRRLVYVQFTEKGLELCRAIEAALDDYEDKFPVIGMDVKGIIDATKHAREAATNLVRLMELTGKRDPRRSPK